MSHLDVVPVEPGTEANWTHPPFSGRIADGFIWGRGALDVKCGALGLLEAAERLLERRLPAVRRRLFRSRARRGDRRREGNQRRRRDAARAGLRFRFVLDEGGGLTEGIIDGVDGPVAFVGIAEKGYATIRLTAQAGGGHASMPPPHTAVGMVAAAVARLESNPFPARIDGRDGRDARLSRSRDALAPPGRAGESLADRRAHRPAVRRQALAERPDPDDHGGHRRPRRRDGECAPEAGRAWSTSASCRAIRRVGPRGDRDRGERLGFDRSRLTCSLDSDTSEPSRVSVDRIGRLPDAPADDRRGLPRAIVAPGLSMAATDSQYYPPIAGTSTASCPSASRARPGADPRGRRTDRRRDV